MTDGSQDGSRRRRPTPLVLLAWVVVGVAMVALSAVAVVRLFVSDPEEPTEAGSVRDVADLAVALTEDLDVPGGVELLCAQPIDLYRMTVESTITRWRGLSGAQVPDVDAEVEDIDDGTSGSFVLQISSPEDGLEDEDRAFRVFVEYQDGRSCVTGVGGPRTQRPTTRFAGDGYTGVTSPRPSPTPRPTTGPTTGAP